MSEPTATPQSPDPLTTFLESFNFSKLDDGELATGVNAFVAMCNALCVLEGPGSSVTDDKVGISYATGVNLLSFIPKTSRVIAERVIGPIQNLQDVFLRRVTRVIQRRQLLTTIRRNRDLVTHPEKEAALGAHNTPLYQLDPDAPEYAPYDFFTEKQATRRNVPYLQPRFVAVGTKPKNVEADLAQVHLGHALLHAPFSRIEEVEAMDEVLNGVMRGSHRPAATKDEPFPGCVGGQVIATVTVPIFSALMKPGLSDATWPTHVVWLPPLLKDGDQRLKVPNEKPNAFDLIAGYQRALKAVLNNRLAGEDPVPCRATGFHLRHVRLLHKIAKLRGLDLVTVDHFANLFVTLYRGIALMVQHSNSNWPAGFTQDGLEALVLSIAATSGSFVEKQRERGKIDIKREEARRIYDKLADGPQSPRDLCRRFDRLAVANCKAALLLLQEWGLIAEENGRWQQVENPEDARRVIETSAIVLS